MKVINLYGGPGVGKTTTAWLLCGALKKLGVEVEFVPEFAKRCVYENRDTLLSEDQLYVLAKQHRGILILAESGVEYAVVDSPLVLSASYNDHKKLNQDIINLLVRELYEKYDNINIFIERSTQRKYDPRGRIQKNYEEAIEKDEEIKRSVSHFGVKCLSTESSDVAVKEILKILGFE
jgi:tRNA uridine 5-carbamoylmethylation protein Kti12